MWSEPTKGRRSRGGREGCRVAGWGITAGWGVLDVLRREGIGSGVAGVWR